MKTRMHGFRLALLFSLVLSSAWCSSSVAQDASAPAAPTFKPEEIEQLVAPIALYPDSLLAQILMASTYPLEVVEAARWSKANPNVKDKGLEDAMQKQTWDPSVKSLTAFPQVLTMMNEKLDWTQKLGDAFLAQQSDVMDAVQRLRIKAQENGNLKTTKEQKVIVEPAPAPPANVQQNVTVEGAAPSPAPQTIVKIEPADPQVVYVPTYNPTTVYGGWPYPSYPPYSYYPPGYVAATSILSFGAGMAVGAALWGNCNWGGYGGHNDVNVNVNNYNNFNKTNIANGNWQHNSEHRKGVGYRDQRTQQKYGRGQSQAARSRDQFRGRAEAGQRDLKGPGGDRARRDLARNQGAGDRGGVGDRGGAGDRGRQQGVGDRGRGGAGDRGASARAGQRGPSTGNRAASNRPGSGSAARQQPSRGASQRSPGAFQGMNSGSQARQASNRGRSSMSSARSSGFSGGSRGGGRGGGGRGGGGRGGGRRR
jgi:hypothetical protein